MTTEVKKSKMYLDHKGNEIPANYIHKIDKQKHSLALKILKQAEKMNAMLAEFKNSTFAECDAIYQQMLDDAKITERKNAKGGYSIMTIDKAVKVQVIISETIHFNDYIDLAQAKVNEYLGIVTNGSNEEIKMLINQAFKTTKGKMDTKRIIGLFSLKITHPVWVEAMELLKKSMDTNSSKRYIQIWKRREDNSGEYDAVKLDFASI